MLNGRIKGTEIYEKIVRSKLAQTSSWNNVILVYLSLQN